MKKSGKKLLSWLLTPALVLGFTPWISLPADAAAAKEVAVNEASLSDSVKSAKEAEESLPDHVKRAKDGTLTYSEDGLGTGNFAEEAIEGGTVYRLYNPNSGEHFYTLSVFERDSVVKAGWNDEGIAYDASVKASDSDAVPVYRVYNPNAPADNSSHHYTCNAAEAQNLVSLGWRFEGVGFYVFEADRKNGMTVYREYNKNNGAHNYTTNKEEHDFLMEAGWADENTAWKVKDVQEVGTQKELEAVLATTSLTDLKIATKKKVELSIPEEDYALVDLVVDAPKASITNAGAFRSIDLRSIAANTWTEKGNNNDIVVNNNKPVRIIVDTLNRLKSLIFNGNIDGVNTLEIPSGTLEQLIVAAQDPIYVSVFGKAEVGSVAIDAATNVNISGKDSAAIGTVDVNAAGADVGITFSDDSTAGNITLSEEASGTADEKASLTLSTKDNAAVGTVEMKAAGATLAVSASGESTIGEIDVSKEASGADTNVEVKAEGSAKIESVTTSAEDANVSVTSNGESTVGTVKLEGSGNATIDGDSNNTTTVDITGANKDAKAVVKKDSVEVETTPDTETSSIVNNESGSSIPTSSKDSNDNETSGSISPKDGGSEGGSEGGSGGGSGGGSSGGGGYTPSTSVNVTGVTIDNKNPKVGDILTATLTPSNATNNAKYDTWKWERSTNKESWTTIGGATTNEYKLVSDDANNYIRVTASGTGVTSYSAVMSEKVVASYAITVVDTTNGTVSVAVNGKTVEGDILAAKDDTIKVTVTPAKGYQLKSLKVENLGSGAPPELSPAVSPTVSEYNFTMADVGRKITAEFEAKTLLVTYDANGGTVPPDGPAPTQVVAYDATEALTKTIEQLGFTNANAGDFLGWNRDPEGGSTAYSAGQNAIDDVKRAIELEVVGITLYAQWAPKGATVSSIAWSGGSIDNASVKESEGTYTIGGKITVKWSDTSASDSTIAASAAEWTFTSSTQSKTESDYVVASKGKVTWTPNDNAFISANDTVKFTGTYEGKTVEFTLTVTNEAQVYLLYKGGNSATYEKFALAVDEQPVANTKVAAGTTVTVVPHPDAGYEVDTVSYKQTGGSTTTPVDKDNNGKYTFQMPGYATEVSVTFKKSNYTVTTTLTETAKGTNHGWIELSPTTAQVGDTITITPHASDGYKLASLSYNDGTDHSINISTVSPTYTFAMPAKNVTVTAEFEKETVVITVPNVSEVENVTAITYSTYTENEGTYMNVGDLTPIENMFTVDKDSYVGFTITFANGYEADQVKIGNTAVTYNEAASAYIFKASEAATLTVSAKVSTTATPVAEADISTTNKTIEGLVVGYESGNTVSIGAGAVTDVEFSYAKTSAEDFDLDGSTVALKAGKGAGEYTGTFTITATGSNTRSGEATKTITVTATVSAPPLENMTGLAIYRIYNTYTAQVTNPANGASFTFYYGDNYTATSAAGLIP